MKAKFGNGKKLAVVAFAALWVGSVAAQPEEEAPAVKGVVVELEDGEFVDAMAAADHPGHTGTGYADFQRYKDASVEAPATLEKAGAYDVVIRYANGSFEKRPLKILVNGKVVVARQEFSPTDDEIWDLYRTVTIKKVPFKAGKNLIKFVSIDEDGPNLDNVTIVTEPPVAEKK